jgi:predicted porin
MQKKLVAIAVAGALGVPALALAQTSTVNIYGKITYEYGRVDSGSGKQTTDYADSPGGSEIGFRGEEKLGGGLSAWFQCASSADVRALDQTGFCTRNSALGFKGGFGNIFFGRWDTPMKRAMNVGTVGAEETGILGNSFLPFGGSGGADATQSGNGVGIHGESIQRQRWKRREAGLSYYESPSFSGFQVMAAVSSGNGTDVTELAGAANAKPRVWSFGATYNNGPLGIGAAYERHNQFGIANAAATDLDDRGWGLSAAYTFGGKVKVGATYLNTKYESSAVTERKRASWTLGVDWNVSGPHSVMAQYAKMGDVKGNDPTQIGGRIGGSNGGVGATGSDTGADSFTIAYQYAFSKRTAVKLGYLRVSNDSNTRAFRMGNSSGALLAPNGQNVDGYAMHLSHRF